MKAGCAAWMFICLFLILPAVFSAPVITTSASGRYRVIGPGARENTDYTRWAEDTTLQLERLLGRPVPLAGGSVVEIVLADSRRGGGAVSARCFRQDSQLKRELMIPSSGPADYGMVQEGLVRLALAGIVEQGRREAGLVPVAPVIPLWLSAGLAGNLDKERLVWSRRILTAVGSDQAAVSAAEVMGWEQLPEGWHSREALCGIVVAWILSMPDARGKLVDRLVRQVPVSPEWVAMAVVGAGSLEAMETRWRAWRQRQERAIQEFGALSQALIERLRNELSLEIKPSPPPGKAGAPVTIRIKPGEILESRKKWPADVALAAAGKIEQLRVVTLGKAPELGEVAERYCRFYQGVAGASWPVVLRWRLYLAESSLERLESLTRAREAYLDDVERERSGKRPNQALLPDGDLVPELEKSRIESYLDEAEKRFHKP